MIVSKKLVVDTKGHSDIQDITDRIREVVEASGILNGIVNIFVIRSTASISTIEYEPALVQDMKDHLESLAPESMTTRHGNTWGDDNGFSHLRATLMGPGMVVPLSDGRLVLGTWQQIVVIDHDNRPRSRELFVQLLGE